MSSSPNASDASRSPRAGNEDVVDVFSDADFAKRVSVKSVSGMILRILVSFLGCIALEFGWGALGLHCFLLLSSAGLIVVLIFMCFWAYSSVALPKARGLHAVCGHRAIYKWVTVSGYDVTFSVST